MPWLRTGPLSRDKHEGPPRALGMSLLRLSDQQDKSPEVHIRGDLGRHSAPPFCSWELPRIAGIRRVGAGLASRGAARQALSDLTQTRLLRIYKGRVLNKK